MICPFHPKYGTPYCRLQVRVVQLNTGEFEVLGYHTCVGEDRCPIFNK